jgi:hypothetical protein
MTLTSGKNLRNFIVGCVWLSSVWLGGTALRGQQFNYTLQVNTTTWSELSSQTLCNSVNQPWQDSYRIPVGFTFPFNGGNYDTLTINTSGALVFDDYGNQAFSAFSGFGGKLDSAGNYSVLGYSLSGSVSNHILKIQFKNIGQSSSPFEFLSYQLWLYESGRIDVICGTNTYQPALNEPTDTAQYILLGAHDMNMTGVYRGYFAGNISNAISGVPCTEQNPIPVYLNTVPASGTRFIFTPSSN